MMVLVNPASSIRGLPIKMNSTSMTSICQKHVDALTAAGSDSAVLHRVQGRALRQICPLKPVGSCGRRAIADNPVSRRRAHDAAREPSGVPPFPDIVFDTIFRET